MNVLVFLLSLLVAVGGSEWITRRFVKVTPQPDYLETIRNTALNRERMWAPNLKVEYDIRGLYAGAKKATLKTSEHRLIQPEPANPSAPKILFLGGSTTEALYVDENQRWVARAGGYNGGQSGANSVDALFAYEYLTQKLGLKFDLVVLMTAVNDLSGELKFRRAGHHLGIDDYHAHLADYYQWHHQSEESWLTRCSQHLSLCELGKRVVAGWKEKKTKAVAEKRANGKEIGNVAANYLANLQTPARRYESKELGAEIDDLLGQYRTNELKILRALQNAVSANGGKLLVMSEPTSYAADSASFYLDLRHPFSINDKALTPESTVEVFDKVNAIYLDSAREVGAKTFDLAKAMQEGGFITGKYFYDEMHYTPEGCEAVASILGGRILYSKDSLFGPSNALARRSPKGEDGWVRGPEKSVSFH